MQIFERIRRKLRSARDTMASYERPEDRPSFLLNGQVNTTLQGNPIPIVGGRCLVGGLVVSAGIFTEKMPV